jgi:hypothetical protein
MTSILIRVPEEMHVALRAAAAQEGTNLSELLRNLAESYLRERQYQQLYDGFTLLGSDPEESDVEFALHAASEVILSDE